MQWQRMTDGDFGSVDFIGNAIHTQLPERPEVFREKFQLFLDGCRILRSGTATVGYGIAHPWLLNSIPPLDALLVALPASPECLFIHDVVVIPEARGHEASAAYVAEMRLVAVQANLPSLALVSVYGTTPLWSRLGFRVVDDATLAPKLASYGSTARYMVSPTNA
jgi:hypothetical protein